MKVSKALRLGKRFARFSRMVVVRLRELTDPIENPGRQLADLRWGPGLGMDRKNRSAIGKALVAKRGSSKGGRPATRGHEGLPLEYPTRGCRCRECRRARGEW